MRFSTRKSHAKKVASIGLLVGAAVLTVGGIVNHYTNSEAQAAGYANGRVYYALRSDYPDTATPNAAMADAAATLGLSSGTAAFCSLGSIDTDYTVTRVNPYTGENAAYWVFADSSETCQNIEDAENGVIINDNGATILDEDHVFDQTSFYGHYDNQFGNELGSFHLVSFYDTYAKVQAYGNVAARNLVSDSNNNIAHFEIPTLSYIKNVSPTVGFRSFNNVGSNTEPEAGGVYGDGDSSVLIVGKDARIGMGDNGSAWTVNGSKVNSPTKRTGSEGQYMNNVWQEYEGGPEFLDFDDMKQNAVTLNERIRAIPSNLPEDNIHHIRGDDSTDPGIIELADDNGANVMDLVAEDLKPAKNVFVVGFDQHKDATLIINVDVKDAPVVDGVKTVTEMMNFMVCYTDESKLDTTKYGNQGNKPATTAQGNYICVNQSWYKDKFPNHIILNYYDSSAPAYSYDADTDIQDEYKIDYTKGTTAITVAPRGNVQVTATPYQGIIIANNIDMESGDSYFLSMSDNLPIFETLTCKIKVQHVNKTTMQVIDGFAYEYTDDCAESKYYTFGPESHITDTLGLNFIDGLYEGEESAVVYRAGVESESTQTTIENNETIDGDMFPVGFHNDQESKVITLYYEPVCSLLVHHINYDTQTTIRDDGPTVMTCNEIAEVGHAQDIIDSGYIAVDNSGNELPVVTPTPIGVTGNPTEYTLYYKTVPTPDTCEIEIHHYVKGTTTKVDDDVYRSGECTTVEYLLDISERALGNGYKFVSGNLWSERYVADYTEDDFPLSVTNNFPKKVYTLYYELDEPTPDTCEIEIHHYVKGTTTKVDDDVYRSGECTTVEYLLDISERALGNGYKFVSGNLWSERYVADYTEADFPVHISNNFPKKVYTLYYEKTPGTPDTKDRSPIFVLSAAGAIIGLGTATMFIARRRQ